MKHEDRLGCLAVAVILAALALLSVTGAAIALDPHTDVQTSDYDGRL